MPAVILVTNPEFVIVTTEPSDETHGFNIAAIGLPVNWVVDPIQMLDNPTTVGKELTTTSTEFWHPFELV